MLNYFKYLAESVLLAAALAGIGWLIAWRAMDASMFSVQSGSMAPVFKKGDLVLDVKPVALKAGDIISYNSLVNPAEIISHRIVKINGDYLITKGDNLNTVDPPLRIGAVRGRAAAMIPKAGYLFDLLRKPAGLIVIVYAPALFITATELWLLTGRYKYRPYRFTQTT